MTLPASGPISLAQVNVELGRAANAPIGLGDTAVANLMHGSLMGPFGPTVDMNDLHGKSAAAPSNFNSSVEIDYNQYTGSSTVNMSLSVSLNTDGSITSNASGYKTITPLGAVNWFTPNTSGIGSSYWVNVTVASGSLGTGATGWQTLGTARTWGITGSVTKTSSGLDRFVTLNFTIAASSGGPALATGTLTMTIQGSGAIQN